MRCPIPGYSQVCTMRQSVGVAVDFFLVFFLSRRCKVFILRQGAASCNGKEGGWHLVGGRGGSHLFGMYRIMLHYL